MQAVRTSAYPVAGNEFDCGFIPAFIGRPHIQAQPAHRFIIMQVRGTGAGMPGGEQVVMQAQHVGAVARAPCS